jgi:predicted enzyme related to lactoylglutathione lyase
MAEKFCWFELLTNNVEAAQEFYGKVIGWTASAPGSAPHHYRMFLADGAPVAGLMTLPDEAKAQGARPLWMGYISTPDVDAEVTAVAAAGGTVHREPETIAQMVRFAVVADPQGATYSLWTDLSGATPAETPPMTPGRVGWCELMTENVDQAFDFYAARYGWTRDRDLDMGPMGVYRLFAAGAMPVGGMMKRPEQVPQAYWGFYFVVEALDAAIERVEAAGGAKLMGPQDVPGGAWIAQFLDPEGVYFALVAAKR